LPKALQAGAVAHGATRGRMPFSLGATLLERQQMKLSECLLILT